MRGLNSETVDLIYLDPPFNSNRDYAAPIGSEAAGAAFKDTWTLSDVDMAWHGEIAEANPALYRVIAAARDAHGKGMQSYLIMMAVRLLEMRRLLKPTGSIYLHCDPTASHYLKMVMDTVFGRERFQADITWKRTSSHNDRAFGSVSDSILFYGNPAPVERARVPLDPDYVARFYRHKDKRGTYRTDNLTGPGISQGESGEPWKGADPTEAGRCWSVPRTGEYAAWIAKNVIPGYDAIAGIHARLDALDKAGLIAWPVKGRRVPQLKRYLEASAGQPAGDVWTDIPTIGAHAKERRKYPTQKPRLLLERIIRASSNENDVVLDPFCGCATALVAAEKLQRQWIGIDLSPQAKTLIETRARTELGLFAWRAVYREDIPRRTDMGKLPPYRTHRHTLYGLYEGKCAGCRNTFEFRNLTVDHIVSQHDGGTDHIENLQPLCGACNSMKGKGTQEAFIAKLKHMGLR